MVFPFIEGRVLKVGCFARSAAHGVVNHRVESAEVANQLFDCVSALHSIGDIAAQDHRSPAGSGNGSFDAFIKALAKPTSFCWPKVKSPMLEWATPYNCIRFSVSSAFC